MIAEFSPVIDETPRTFASTRVAIVDDNPQVRRLLRLLFGVVASTVVVAEIEDGVHAAQLIAESQADVVIMDYDMPGVDGVQATREVRAARPAAQVVAFTSSGDDARVAARFREAGAAEQFDKTQVRELVAFVGALASQP